MHRIDPRGIAAAFGAVYVAVGLIGLALTGFDDPTTPSGAHLLLFEVNPLQNLVHIASGSLLLAAGVAPSRLNRWLVGVVGAVYGVGGVVGLAVVDTPGNVLAVNHWDNALHLLTGLAALASLIGARPRASRRDLAGADR